MNLTEKAKAAQEIQNHLHILNDPNQSYLSKAQSLQQLKTLVSQTAHYFTTEDLQQGPTLQLLEREQALATAFAQQTPLAAYFVGTFLNEQKLFETLAQQQDGSWGFLLNSQKQLRTIAKFSAPFDFIQSGFETAPLPAYENLEVAFEQYIKSKPTSAHADIVLWRTQTIDTSVVYPIDIKITDDTLKPNVLLEDFVCPNTHDLRPQHITEKDQVMYPLFECEHVVLQSDSALVRHIDSFEFLHYRDLAFQGFQQQGLDLFVWNRRAGLAEKRLFLAIREHGDGGFHDVIAFAQFPDLESIHAFYAQHLSLHPSQAIATLSQIKSVLLDDYFASSKTAESFTALWLHAHTEWSQQPQLHWLPLNQIQTNQILKFQEDPASQSEPLFVLNDRPVNRLLYGHQRLALAQTQHEAVVPAYLLERNAAFSWENIQTLLHQMTGRPLTLSQFKMIVLESMLISPS